MLERKCQKRHVISSTHTVWVETTFFVGFKFSPHDYHNIFSRRTLFQNTWKMFLIPNICIWMPVITFPLMIFSSYLRSWGRSKFYYFQKFLHKNTRRISSVKSIISITVLGQTHISHFCLPVIWSNCTSIRHAILVQITFL